MAAVTKADRRYGNPPKRPSKALRDAAAAGRGGDSILAHIGPQEAAVLKAMGGAGTVNPSTGLLEFNTTAGTDAGVRGESTAAGAGNTAAGSPGGAKSDGTAAAGGSTNGGAGADLRSDGTAATGNSTMGDHSRPDLAGSTLPGGNSTLGNSTDLRGPTTAEKKGSGTASGALTAPTPKLNTLPPGTLGTTTTPNFDALAAAGTGLSQGGYVKAAANMGKAYADYKDYGNTFAEDVGNFLASYAGFNEIKPTKQDIKNFVKQDQADWGFDPAGLIGGAAGMAAGVPGGGIAADLISRALGRPLEINVGPDVGATLGLGGTAKSERRYGGKQ